MEKFSLKWNDFQTNVVQSFQQLRHEEEISDVTLIGDDYQPILAHKVVLSACSDYFKKVFYRSGTKHSTPVLCLVGLSHDDLKNVLDYIYNGELQIYQEDLERFLAIAGRLKLEGLIGQEEPINKIDDFQEESPMTASSPSGDEALSSKVRNVAKVQDDKKIVIQSGFSDIASLDEQLEEMFSRDQSGIYSCHNCPKIFKKRGHMLEHVETHVEGLQFNCNFCSKLSRSRNSLKVHVWRVHNTKTN